MEINYLIKDLINSYVKKDFLKTAFLDTAKSHQIF